MALYAIVRVDRRFNVPLEVQESYMAAGKSSGLGNTFDWGVYRQMQLKQDGMLRVYSEEELFELPEKYPIPSTRSKLRDTRKWPTEATRTAGREKSDMDPLLPVFSNCVDQKIQKCLSRDTLKLREEPLKSGANLVATMTPSSLSTASLRLSAYSSTALQAATSSITTPSIVREIASPHQIVSQHVGETLDQNVNRIQEQLVYLKKGETAKYSFGMNGLLHVRVPGLHLSLELDTRSTDNMDTNDAVTSQIQQTQQRSLQIELERLSSMPCTKVGLAPIVVDLEDEWAEKSPPEGVLFSAEGLLLKRKSTFLRLRARWD